VKHTDRQLPAARGRVERSCQLRLEAGDEFTLRRRIEQQSGAAQQVRAHSVRVAGVEREQAIRPAAGRRVALRGSLQPVPTGGLHEFADQPVRIVDALEPFFVGVDERLEKRQSSRGIDRQQLTHDLIQPGPERVYECRRLSIVVEAR